MPIKDNKLIQIAYVLTSNGKDVYANMNLISLRSLRYSNSNAKIILVCDCDTVQALETYNHAILQEADQIISVTTPDQPASFRNRFIKTSLRQHLSGDFLYLDGDTVIRGDLTPIFDIKTSLAAVPNHSGSGNPAEIPFDERENIIFLGWTLPTQYYVNGGVLFFVDNPDTEKFCQLWHQKWLASAEKRGTFRDQPSLNSAIADSGVSFSWLPHPFNAQVDVRPIYAKDAIVWHLYSSNGEIAMKTLFHQYIDLLQSEKNVCTDQIEYLCKRSHPWPINNPIDWWFVEKMSSSSQFVEKNSLTRLWMSGNYQRFNSYFFTLSHIKLLLKSMYKKFFY
ncbi:glycosyltransferase [Geminocystis sp. NIES-3709]|uniref:glycosyltransferase n=1 Tax=Geminocystis sp. NIES-3709 TaxID=1617448 RepID=UPI0005FCC540|nr:glycosyltransferase [Geminocystis sp. NIES-3709]BAQ66826.1 glycosyl transferase [Geminocystis sp. NIES-3709]